jgi:site-specific DNA-methyltransferase (adenine-specific)
MPVSEVFNSDCLEGMKQYPDKYFDLAIVDPPYGINAPNMQMGSNPNRSRSDGHGSGPGISTSKKVKNRLQRLNGCGGKLKNRILNKSVIEWDNEIPSPEYFAEVMRISKNQIIWGGNYFPLPPTRCVICWDKMQPWDNFSQWEMAWTSFDKPAKMFRYSNTGGANSETKIHPTQKPIKLYDYLYHTFAEPGQRILDTHLGSGSNRISADKFGVDFIAFEINKMHFEDQEKRFQQYKSQLKLF